ncbi:MAG TPA: ferredoxin, partial [Chloroflexi bacterium]|nr:ferredoxin [Chloroflexota bacterium]
MPGSIALCTIDFEPVGKRVQVPHGTSLMEAARLAGITLSSTCGGEGTCGRCRVGLREGSLSEPGEADLHFLSQLELLSGQRLACQAQVQGDVKVDIPRASLATAQRLQLESTSGEVQVDAVVRPFEVEVPPPTLEDPRSDLERVLAAMESAHGIRRLRAA